jgi:hypothetical protein
MMSTDSNRKSTGDPSTPDAASDPHARLIEERYAEWEQEFGDEIDSRRTHGFDPKR